MKKFLKRRLIFSRKEQNLFIMDCQYFNWSVTGQRGRKRITKPQKIILVTLSFMIR
jgi:hypothetical protein